MTNKQIKELIRAIQQPSVGKLVIQALMRHNKQIGICDAGLEYYTPYVKKLLVIMLAEYEQMLKKEDISNQMDIEESILEAMGAMQQNSRQNE